MTGPPPASASIPSSLPIEAPSIAVPSPSDPSSSSHQKSSASLLKSPSDLNPPPIDLIPPSTRHGEPALKLTRSIVDRLSEPFKYSLVGKFSHGRPTLEKARLIFAKFNLKGSYQLGHLDQKHMLIRLSTEANFNRLWLKELCLPNLPIFLFNKQSLYSITRMIGTPLTIDIATAELFRLSVAKICVQLDLLKKLPPRVWIEWEDSAPGF